MNLQRLITLTSRCLSLSTKFIRASKVETHSSDRDNFHFQTTNNEDEEVGALHGLPVLVLIAIYPLRGGESEFTWVAVIYQNGLPTCKWSPISVLTGFMHSNYDDRDQCITTKPNCHYIYAIMNTETTVCTTSIYHFIICCTHHMPFMSVDKCIQNAR